MSNNILIIPKKKTIGKKIKRTTNTRLEKYTIICNHSRDCTNDIQSEYIDDCKFDSDSDSDCRLSCASMSDCNLKCESKSESESSTEITSDCEPENPPTGPQCLSIKDPIGPARPGCDFVSHRIDLSNTTPQYTFNIPNDIKNIYLTLWGNCKPNMCETCENGGGGGGVIIEYWQPQ